MKVTLLSQSTRALKALHQPARSVILANRSYGTVSEAPIDPATMGIRKEKSVFRTAVDATAPRINWTRDEIKEIYDMSLMELAFAAVCPLSDISLICTE